MNYQDPEAVTLDALTYLLDEMCEERQRNAFDYDPSSWRGQRNRARLAGALRNLRRAIASTRTRAYHARMARVA